MPQNIPAAQPVIWPTDDSSTDKATLWSKRLGLQLTNTLPEGNHPILVVNQGRLELHLGKPNKKGVYAEFSAQKAHIIQRQEGKNGLLVRAIGLRKTGSPKVLDATAGLGRDSFLMASHGCQVRSFERSPIVAALLEDGLERGLTDPDTQRIIQHGLELHVTDARDFMQHHPDNPWADVVYLDPMFTRRNHGAMSKKEMQLLRMLVGDDDDAPGLLDAAISHAANRVVVKRSLKAPVIGNRVPHFSIRGTTIRFDVYLAAAK